MGTILIRGDTIVYASPAWSNFSEFSEDFYEIF
jgi:hypothetical protein